MIPAPAPLIQAATALGRSRAAQNDNRASDVRLDQYYTRQDVADHLYRVFQKHYDPTLFRMVEPSAGTGSFFSLLPRGSLGFDVEPKYPGVATADFLTIRFDGTRPVAVIGTPPFGKNASTAVQFFNHAAWQSSVIAFILPRSFRKASIVNRLDGAFHLVYEEIVPDDAFLFRGKPYNVPAVFQIWERRSQLRQRHSGDTRHPDFEFTTPERADFVIQRVGARAGRVHHDLRASPNSHYFIRGNVEAIMAQLDFASVVGNVAGNPSLSKAEVVWLYCDYVNGKRSLVSSIGSCAGVSTVTPSAIAGQANQPRSSRLAWRTRPWPLHHNSFTGSPGLPWNAYTAPPNGS